jgi:superfamily II DNA or RNA helicase
MVITLTEQQKLAQKDQQEKISELFNAYKNGVKQLGLFGKAGVGKTKSMIRLVNLIRQWDNSIKTIKAAANTHRAKDVLKENLDDDTIDCYTIASLLNYKRIISKDGKEEYKPSTITKYSRELRAQVSIPPPVSVADLIIIDECSQVNKETYDNIVNYATNAKVIIFMGDWHQTPPVEKDAQSILLGDLNGTLRFMHATSEGAAY